MQDVTALFGNITGKVWKETSNICGGPHLRSQQSHICQFGMEFVRLKVSKKASQVFSTCAARLS